MAQDDCLNCRFSEKCGRTATTPCLLADTMSGKRPSWLTADVPAAHVIDGGITLQNPTYRSMHVKAGGPSRLPAIPS